MLMEIWKIILISIIPPLYWPMLNNLSQKRRWTALNYEKKHIPYSLGAGLFFFVIGYLVVWRPEYSIAFLAYTGMTWLAGWVDDQSGELYPKGIKGHLTYLIQQKQWTTGLTKIVFIISASASSLYLLDDGFKMGTIVAFLLLVLSPHVCNALDTRPLRVWKWFVIHLLLFCIGFPFFPSWELFILGTTAVVFWWGVETKRSGMLGDNGAALVGGFIAWISIQYTPTAFQAVLVLLYFSLTLMAEKVSFHSVIKNVRFLYQLDQWGRKEG